MEHNRNDEKHSQTGIIVTIHTNHDCVRATSIMQGSIAASSSSRSSDIAVKKASELHRPPFEWTSKRLLWYPFRCDEWKATSVTAEEYYSTVTASNPEFGCRSCLTHKPCAVCFLCVMGKNLRVFMSHNSAGFHWTFHFQILYLKLQQLQANVLISTCRTLSICELLQIVTFDGLWTLMLWNF